MSKLGIWKLVAVHNFVQVRSPTAPQQVQCTVRVVNVVIFTIGKINHRMHRSLIECDRRSELAGHLMEVTISAVAGMLQWIGLGQREKKREIEVIERVGAVKDMAMMVGSLEIVRVGYVRNQKLIRKRVDVSHANLELWGILGVSEIKRR
jgi:hypothetical protein